MLIALPSGLSPLHSLFILLPSSLPYFILPSSSASSFTSSFLYSKNHPPFPSHSYSDSSPLDPCPSLHLTYSFLLHHLFLFTAFSFRLSCSFTDLPLISTHHYFSLPPPSAGNSHLFSIVYYSSVFSLYRFGIIIDDHPQRYGSIALQFPSHVQLENF